MTSCSIIIPTRGRPGYLDATLRSVAPQAAAAPAELIVIDDGDDARTRTTAQHHGVKLIATRRRGANAARNVGIAAADGALIVLLDDDVEAPAGWLAALLDGVRGTPERDVFGGPIRAVLDGGGPRSCGREGAAITTLALGSIDRDVDFVWSANMAIRRGALDRVGPFDESIHGRGEEEEWQRRHRAAGGHVRYLAAAGILHRRVGRDASLTSLTRAQYRLGRTARRYDVRRDAAPSRVSELGMLLRCAGHVVRYRCPNMVAVGAESAGRLREALTDGESGGS